MDEIDIVEHGLIIDWGKTSDDLHKQAVMGVCFLIVAVQDLKDIPIEIECILEISYLILELVILLAEVICIHYSFKLILLLLFNPMQSNKTIWKWYK